MIITDDVVSWTDLRHCSDQFCSLIFTLSNLYFIPCAYNGGLNTNWQRCTAKTPIWGVPFVLASLPLLARAVQSVKRWYDSRLYTHLINVSQARVLFCKPLKLTILYRVESMQRESSTTYATSSGGIKVRSKELFPDIIWLNMRQVVTADVVSQPGASLVPSIRCMLQPG